LAQQESGPDFRVITSSPSQTMQVGEALGRLAPPGSVVCLRGNLGSGKTCLTQGIGRGLGVYGVIHSPTFVFINEHPNLSTRPSLYHVDLYRVHDEADVLALGLEDYMYGDGVTVIEWAERAEGLLPSDCLWVDIRYVDEHTRTLTFRPHGAAYVDLVTRLRNELVAADLAVASTPSAEW